MADEELINTEEAPETPVEEAATGNEPHGSASAPRPGDRKYGNRKGRPSERRGGRGGFRRNTDDYLERVVAINRISKTTQGGKNVRFSALAVVGDGKGRYGFALSKSSEVPDAIKKALAKARKNMVTVELVNGTSRLETSPRRHWYRRWRRRPCGRRTRRGQEPRREGLRFPFPHQRHPRHKRRPCRFEAL